MDTRTGAGGHVDKANPATVKPSSRSTGTYAEYRGVPAPIL